MYEFMHACIYMCVATLFDFVKIKIVTYIVWYVSLMFCPIRSGPIRWTYMKIEPRFAGVGFIESWSVHGGKHYQHKANIRSTLSGKHNFDSK